MVDFVYGELKLPEEAVGWREAMRTLALRIRDVLLDHSTLRSRNWSSRDEARAQLAPQTSLLMKAGRYPRYEHCLRTATREDDLRWQFETGLDCVLDGIAARLAT